MSRDPRKDRARKRRLRDWLRIALLGAMERIATEREQDRLIEAALAEQPPSDF